VYHHNSTQYCNTETVLVQYSPPPDQHHISDRRKGKGRVERELKRDKGDRKEGENREWREGKMQEINAKYLALSGKQLRCLY